ncbi:MAG: carboxymuconolactone decarboxylase family protein [Gammaproteobacteria bacterium]
MKEFKVHDVKTAPSDSRADLEKINKDNGNIPNVYAVMAESPQLLKAHMAARELFNKATLGKQDRKIVLLAVSRELGSAYDMAVHSGAAEKHNVPAEVIESVRAGTALKDKKLEALRSFTTHVVKQHGEVADGEIKAFLDAGYSHANVLEIVLAAGMVTWTSYTSQIAKIELDAQFEQKVWKKAS